MLELDDRNGGIVDYGIFGADGAQIRVTAGGQSTLASTTAIPGVADATLFWVRRGGVIAGPTGAVGGPSPDVVFTAVDAAGRTLGAGAPYVQRNDGVVHSSDGFSPIGEFMRTGLTLDDGGELVFWCDGDQRAVMLHAGSDGRRGTVTELRNLGSLSRPPYPSGFYLGYNTFPLTGGGSVVVALYVGDAASVEMRGAGGAAVGSHGAAVWSAHPQLRILWATGVTGRPTAVARDDTGKVLLTTDFTEPATTTTIRPGG